jgi:hypothetical protein
MIVCNFDGIPNARGGTMDGVPMQAPLAKPVTLNDQTFIQFDSYYPMDSNGKLMRIELWSSSSGGTRTMALTLLSAKTLPACFIMNMIFSNLPRLRLPITWCGN